MRTERPVQLSVAARRNDDGLSLVELLMVVAIISILAALGLKGMQDIKERAKVVQCMGILRGLGAALQMYALDHDGRIPERNEDTVEIWGVGPCDIRFPLVE